MIYADTSLLLPIYVPEVNSLARKVKLGTLPPERADEVRSAFEQHMSDGFLQRVAVVGSHGEAAGQLAFQSPVMLRTLDAIHLAVAVELEARVATLDGRLSEAARALGVEVLPQP